MNTDILGSIIITILLTLFIVFSINWTTKQNKLQIEGYEKTLEFITNCADSNGVYSEAQTSKKEKTMVCSKMDIN